ncbi:MAG: YifB family Mg chelatase-like AAA ATPase [Geodermatophilaceae bacterium]|nr:YifB family Mg chelatase-like AAA ATPase [Geodermatophilaceae bacterium]
MPLARTSSVGLVGLQGHLVEIEADLSKGIPNFTMIGLPDTSVREARDRIRAALVNSEQSWPRRRITINLSPATLPKRGSGFDLALAVALLAAAGVVPASALGDTALLGELGLDGSVRPLRGVLPSVLAAQRAGLHRVIVPADNLAEACLVPKVDVVGVASLADLVGYLRGEQCRVFIGAVAEERPPLPGPDLRDIVGQAQGRRALEVAAAGGHHLYLQGPPGAGKTMLAERLSGILPRLDDDEALEVTAIHSVAGVLPPDSPFVRRPPYESPHHTSSTASIVGGGSGIARPGAISRAHRGVLFLDEAPEFASGVLDALRQPLESGQVTLHRSGGQARYPAAFQLVLAANPCPCASPGGDQSCVCTSLTRRRYLGRLSGPLLDRVDLHVTLLPVTRQALLGDGVAEASVDVAQRVLAARAAAAERLAVDGLRRNADIPGPALRRRWRLARSTMTGVEAALDRGLLSARGVDRVLRVAWTLADLTGAASPGRSELDEAMGMRLRGYAA